LEEAQIEFQNLICSGLGSDPILGKISQVVELAVTIDKAIKEAQDFLKLIAEGEEILKKRGFDMDSISVPSKEAINNYLVDVMEI
jgi:hypothetical protein